MLLPSPRHSGFRVVTAYPSVAMSCVADTRFMQKSTASRSGSAATQAAKSCEATTSISAIVRPFSTSSQRLREP